MKQRCHAVAVRVWDLAHAYDIRLSCTWMSHTSTEIMVADDLSKFFDSSEYKLSPNDFEKLHKIFGPFCLDLFKPFCSRLLCKDMAAVDAFTVDWSSFTNGFFHPPVGLVTRVLKHAQYVKAKGVLIIPVWESVDCWPVIIRLVAAQWIESETFIGKSDFDFVAFQFRF